MEIKKEDLSFVCSELRYMLFYKQRPIGGAGVDLSTRKGGHERRAKLLQENREAAEREINALIEGRGQPRFLMAIAGE